MLETEPAEVADPEGDESFYLRAGKGEAMNELFEIPDSDAPLIVTLRKRYDEAKADLKIAQEIKDWTGASIPPAVTAALINARANLQMEEERLAGK